MNRFAPVNPAEMPSHSARVLSPVAVVGMGLGSRRLPLIDAKIFYRFGNVVVLSSGLDLLVDFRPA